MKRTFVIENECIRRVLEVEQNASLRTCSLIDKTSGTEYAGKEYGCEFLLGINGKTVFGYKESTEHVLDGEVQKSAFRLNFIGADQSDPHITRIFFTMDEIDAHIAVCYEISPELPCIQKWIEISAGSQELVIEKLFFEVLNACPGYLPDVQFFMRHGQEQEKRMFVTRGFDDVLQAHNSVSDDGWLIAHTAPGPLNRFLVYPYWTDTAVSVGYTTDTVPFRKYLAKGEKFISHRAVMMLYHGRQDAPEIRNQFRRCLRTCLPEYIRDDFMYCTWIPFLKNINASLLLELAEKAAELGMTTFVVDDGWFVDGNWQVDQKKFPEGLEVVAERVRSLGMRFGLWFNMGTDYGAKGSTPEYNALDASGAFKSAGFVPGHPIKCLASGYREILVKKLCDLAEQYGVGYFKLDFSSIVSPYGLVPMGCHAHSHAGHRDGQDAVLEQYAGLGGIRDEIKSRFSDLILDFSFESFGTDWPNLAALQSSELHHVSNLNTRDEKLCNARDIRNTLYRFGTLLPIERIMGSLICLEGEHFLENLLTSLIGAPLLSGDLRKLNATDIALASRVIQKIRVLTDNGPFTEFVKLRGDSYIRVDEWDGFARFRQDGVGILCLFQNESTENPRLCLDLSCAGTITFHDLLSEEEVLSTPTETLRRGVDLKWNLHRRCHIFCFTTLPIRPLKNLYAVRREKEEPQMDTD